MRLLLLPPVIAALAVGIPPALAALPSASAEQPARPCARLDAVTWRLDFDAEGRVTRVALEQILDPLNGRTPEEAATRPIRLDLPAAYLAAAEAFLRALPPQLPLTTAYSFTTYDPAQPDRANPECGQERS